MIAIIDYGVGNSGSIFNMLKKIGTESIISSNIDQIKIASKLILPGVGSFDTAMEKLNESGLVEILSKKVIDDKTPILGICLGMQLFSKSSEEGKLTGLGWLNMVTKKFESGTVENKIKIPHMGWNQVIQKKNSRLFNEMFDMPKFYFVHSYYVSPNFENDILTTTNYGIEFTSSIEKDNIFGVQFHPEKSHKFGMLLLKNFSNL